MPVPASTAEVMVAFDEGLKRYSYGAPVETARSLLTLIEAGVVDPRAADDPDITLVPGGWRLQSDDRAVTARVMIDSVLPQPALQAVTEPLVTGLHAASALTAAGAGLGARVAPDAAVIGAIGAPVHGLSLVGRLTSGSTIAFDSIHDCFGDISDRWAQRVLLPAARTPTGSCSDPGAAGS